MAVWQIILLVIVGWFLISIPASLFIAWLMSIKDCPRDILDDYDLEQNPQLTEAITKNSLPSYEERSA